MEGERGEKAGYGIGKGRENDEKKDFCRKFISRILSHIFTVRPQ
jgi:hypothetical protein